MNNILLT